MQHIVYIVQDFLYIIYDKKELQNDEDSMKGIRMVENFQHQKTLRENINFDLDVLFRYINLTRLAGSHNLSISFVLMNGSSFLTSNRNGFCRFVFTCVLLNYIKSGTVSHISSVSVLMV